MAAKKGNMFGSYGAAADQREKEQAKIEASVTGKKEGRVKKRGSNATTITLSISSEDKDAVKSLAMQRGLAVSDLLHLWIQDAQKE